MAALITSLNNGSQKIPGEYAVGYGVAVNRMPAPIVGEQTTGGIAPGLFVCRDLTSTDMNTVYGLDKLGDTATVENVVGVCVRAKADYAAGTIALADMADYFYAAGDVIDVQTDQKGYINVWAGTAITDQTKLFVATVTATVSGVVIPAGSLVAQGTTACSPLDITSIAGFSPDQGIFSVAQGDIIGIKLSILSA